MAQHPTRAGAPEARRRSLRTSLGALTVFILTIAVDLAAETTAYRCTGDDGKIEFRQGPCASGTEAEEIGIADRQTGWTPPAPMPEVTTRKEQKARGGGESSSEQDAAQAKRDDQCWNKRHQLDEVNWKLRRGYKPGKDVALRHKRRDYEEYIDRYCR